MECDTCFGTGECMTMVCYGDMPQERMEAYPDCDGIGTVDHLINNASGAKCSSCGRDYPYAKLMKGFICWGVKMDVEP